MKASQLVSVIRAAYIARQPLMLWGKPGVGKTSILRHCSELDKVEHMIYELPLMDSVDLRGIPARNKAGLTEWGAPADLPTKGAGYLCLDDMSQAAISTSNAATRLILEGRLGSYTLPKDWWVCGTGNREEDGATAQRMPTPTANRFIHLTMEPDANDWLTWAESSNIDARCIAFIKFRPELIHVFDPRSKEKAFASPRSWEFMSRMLGALEKVNGKHSWESEERMELTAGIIGNKAALEFIGFLRLMEKLVTIESILLDPKKAMVPKDAAVLYALTYALADRVERKTLGAAVTYIDRLSKEFGFLFMRRMGIVQPDLKKSKEFIEWCSKNQDFV